MWARNMVWAIMCCMRQTSLFTSDTTIIFVVCGLHENLRLGNRASFAYFFRCFDIVFLNAFVFNLKSVGYIASNKINCQKIDKIENSHPKEFL